MGTIHRRIIESTEFDVGSSCTPTLVLGASPDVAPVSETNVRSHPDCCGQLVSNHSIHTTQCGYPPKEKGNYHWFNIAYVEEYTKTNSINDRNDNVLKILWSLHHMMIVDRRRRFAFGVTIENTNTRIWFCCRQIVFVTQHFDFMKEPTKLIRLISSLAYANVAKLGYDPTMELFWKDDKWNYQITVEGKDIHRKIVTKVYRTVDVIADMSSNLRGRATRVYEAYDVEDPDSRVVIKDSWLDTNRPKEGDTLSEILDGASDEEKAMFLTVLVHGVVTIDGSEDRTQDLIMNGYLVSTDSPKANKWSGNSGNTLLKKLEKRMGNLHICDRGSVEDTTRGDHIYKPSIFEVLRPSKPRSQSDSQAESLVTSESPDVQVTTSNQTVCAPRVYGPKAHYRIVFKERGQSLHSMSCTRQIKLSHVVQAMHDILEALAFLTRKGYVHRDISPGNIIFFEGRAKLSDLEFTKQYESGASNHIRTGTYNFMAVEVEGGAYMNQVKGVFSHNPLHDIESLWWVGVWFSLCHYPSEIVRDTTDVHWHFDFVRTYGETLFNNPTTSCPLSRRHALTSQDLLYNIEPQYFPVAVQYLIILLEDFRDQLLTYYELDKSTESQAPSRLFFNPDLHCKFSGIVEEAMKNLKDDHTGLWRISDIKKHIAYLNTNK